MYQFKATGIHCKSCALNITDSILEKDENAKVNVEVKEGLIQVESKSSLSDVKSAIEEAGFKVIEEKNI